MSRKSHGSAAVAFAMPESAERRALLNCIAQLHLTTTVGELAVRGRHPENAAADLIGTLDDLHKDIEVIRAELARTSSD